MHSLESITRMSFSLLYSFDLKAVVCPHGKRDCRVFAWWPSRDQSARSKHSTLPASNLCDKVQTVTAQNCQNGWNFQNSCLLLHSLARSLSGKIHIVRHCWKLFNRIVSCLGVGNTQFKLYIYIYIIPITTYPENRTRKHVHFHVILCPCHPTVIPAFWSASIPWWFHKQVAF